MLGGWVGNKRKEENTMNLRELQEMYDLAKLTYKEGVRLEVRDKIAELLRSINVDVFNGTYEAEIFDEDTAMGLSDEEFDKHEENEQAVRDVLRECEGQLYEMVEEIDEWCSVCVSLYSNATIGIEVEVDEMKLEYEFKNRYSK